MVIHSSIFVRHVSISTLTIGFIFPPPLEINNCNWLPMAHIDWLKVGTTLTGTGIHCSHKTGTSWHFYVKSCHNKTSISFWENQCQYIQRGLYCWGIPHCHVTWRSQVGMHHTKRRLSSPTWSPFRCFHLDQWDLEGPSNVHSTTPSTKRVTGQTKLFK